MPSDEEWSDRYLDRFSELPTVMTVIVLESLSEVKNLDAISICGKANGPVSRF